MGFWDEIEVSDDIFDVDAVEAGAWVPGPYGLGDKRGTFNEVTPVRTAAALARLDLSRPVKAYNLSETLHNSFPASATVPMSRGWPLLGTSRRPASRPSRGWGASSSSERRSAPTG